MARPKKTVEKVEEVKEVKKVEEETSRFPFTVKLYGQKIMMVGESETEFISANGCTYSKNHPDFK